MANQTELNILICNILNAKRYSYCRLCLNKIVDEYVRFDDMVSLEPLGEDITLSQVLTKLLGESICEEIPAAEVVCPNCVDNALRSLRFLEKSKHNTDILTQAFDNLTKSFSGACKINNKNQALFVTIKDAETNVVVVNYNSNKKNDLLQEDPLECSECGDTFDSSSKLTDHNLYLHNAYTCEKCFDTFESQEELDHHIDTHHKHQCPECSQCCNSEESLQEHQDRAHNLYVCKECGKSYKGLAKLHIHESKHSSKNACPKCGKTYATKEFYYKHIKLCLVDQLDPHPFRTKYLKIYSCDKCDKSYSTPGGLRVHNRFVHENAKPHVCKECGKKFTAPSYLRIHMIKHTGEKNYRCNLCSSRFVSKEALLYHTRRHTGEKPYSCNICSERFVNASARAEHMKFRHLGPTLMCELCSRKFVTSHFLRQHISRHHDPSSKLFYGRDMVPPNMPGDQNMRFKVEIEY